eukprot:CAMPEP_0119007262 /NCGR_PEP_ID=MMETSP1176-20130426/2894_1 /TAXON_ID=265551 /ORGANISM="Synedropsis recta cf, Strain CCMP1620" /LENGTH=505 /DNA_ID=CAMNT_0006959377 /DNA_START=123 /DNA_END=1640 /DNA_ORIENTATION=+
MEESNPIFQPQFGAHRYGNSRSMMVQQTQENDSVHAVNDAQHNTWMHPLQSHPSRFAPPSRSTRATPNHVPLHHEHIHFSEPQGMIKAVLSTLNNQLHRVMKILQQTEETVPHFMQHDQKPKKTNKERIIQLAGPCVLLVLANFMGLLPTRLFHSSRGWERLETRKLNGRSCVFNLFIDKLDHNEFDPDYNPSNKEQTPVPVEGTYRTKGQVEVINRFISSVAAAFRPNVSVQQHVVFAGTRDGGHLAKEALKHWPARGTYRTQLHVFADQSKDELDYESVQNIEDQFKEDEEDVHIYDSMGNVAGHEGNKNDDDEAEEDLGQNRRISIETKFDALPDLKNIIFDPDEEDDSVIPYLHVDGTSMAMQMSVLAQTEHLLEEHKIVVIGLEHTPDLDANELIEFFRRNNYKTFMLGLRQLTRIDNLCPEILDNVMTHPSLASPDETWLNIIGDQQNNVLRMPPFFVAMPRGRHSKEEMGIQHTYDLFSGASGLLQVKTANDRVANVK